MPSKQDRNFDHLLKRFEKIVYDTAKGDWRLKLLKEDLQFLRDNDQLLTIWDAGCGFAQMSQWFAEQGHRLTLCDISEKMLVHAQANFAKSGLPAKFYQLSAQQLAAESPTFDLVLFHAVLEWLVNPLETLSDIASTVKAEGYLSLMFYNRNAMVYKNILKGGWRLRQVLDDNYLGKGKKLSPPNPQYPHDVIAHLEMLGFTVTQQTGIRVFHDYLPDDVLAQSDTAELFELEYRYCRKPTYRDMGRYVHIVAQRGSDTRAVT